MLDLLYHPPQTISCHSGRCGVLVDAHGIEHRIMPPDLAHSFRSVMTGGVADRGKNTTVIHDHGFARRQTA
jgi:hypothetical protein